MKVLMIAVASVNGKITRGDDPNIYKWTSKEDQELFFDLLDRAKLIIMGSRTYEAARSLIKHKQGRLRVVLTRTSQKYKSEEIEGALEFTSETPSQLINRLTSHREMLLAGGGEINLLFLKAGLVDEIYLTIEPLIFGKGMPLFADGEFDSKLKLESIDKLNARGTLLLKYKVIK